MTKCFYQSNAVEGKKDRVKKKNVASRKRFELLLPGWNPGVLGQLDERDKAVIIENLDLKDKKIA